MVLSRSFANRQRCNAGFRGVALAACAAVLLGGRAGLLEGGARADDGPLFNKKTDARTAKTEARGDAKSGGGKVVSDSRPKTELDISGPYTAQINEETFPSVLEVWGNDAILKITMDGQDRPMLGTFTSNTLRVLSSYGAANFNLTTGVQAKYDGWAFSGQYARVDQKLGRKLAPITLTPAWYGGGGGGGTKMPLPRKPDDIPGKYGLQLSKDGKQIADQASIAVDNGTVKITAGGRVYQGDVSGTTMAPVYWEGNRMDTFKLTATENGYKGTLTKEVNGKEEQYDVNMVKGEGTGGGGHERDWTYVYDVIFNNSPPVWIGKITLHEEAANVEIMVKGERYHMSGSLVENVLSATGQHGKGTVSIRAQQNPHGFSGVFRSGVGAAVQEGSIVLRNRPVRAGASAPNW